MKEKRWTKPRHKVLFTLFYPLFHLWMRISFGFHGKKFKMAKKQNYLILANHTCGFDPFFVSISFPGKPIYFVSSDDLLRIKGASFWLRWAAAPIPKKKDVTDYALATTCLKIAKEGGNIAIFPEGNRSYSGQLGPLDESVAKFAKFLGLPILLYRIENGYGVDPRWANKRRKGKVFGSVVREISAETAKSTSSKELLEWIKKGLNAPLNHEEKYRSKKKAERLERVLYICPKCGKWKTIESQGNKVRCTSCGLEAEYGEDMKFHSEDPSFPFVTVADWYQFQKDTLKEASFEAGQTIVSDEGVSVFFSKKDGPKEKIAEGKLMMNKEGLRLEGKPDNIILSFGSLRGVGITGKNKIVCYNLSGDSYTFAGQESFNAYKYSQIFAKIADRFDQSL